MSSLSFSGDVQFLQAADGEAAAGPRQFRIVAYTGAPIRQGWSREPVIIDMAGMSLPATVPIVLGHDYALGSILGQGRPSVQGGQLIVEGEILADGENARQVLALAERGYQWQASVGADVGRHLKYGDDQATSVNGATVTGPVPNREGLDTARDLFRHFGGRSQYGRLDSRRRGRGDSYGG
jgi:hypothetical protein